MLNLKFGTATTANPKLTAAAVITNLMAVNFLTVNEDEILFLDA